MISTISQNASLVISVSVGQEIRVRKPHDAGDTEKQRSIDKKNADHKESTELQESHVPDKVPEQIQEVISRLETTLQDFAPRFELSVDEELNKVVLRVLDKESGDLIRQIPAEDVLALKRFLSDQSGLFVEAKI